MNQQTEIDVLVVGAGFAGLYALHRLRGDGHRVLVVEAGDAIGGTWFWNRYPGARCDVESMQYSYSFSPEIEQEWHWTERYARQGEILSYINFVADRLDLKRDVRLKTRVTAASFDETTSRWAIETTSGERLGARFLIMATGCLSMPQELRIPGIEAFRGPVYRTSDWPKDPVDLSAARIGLIGTGSSGIQTATALAGHCRHLTVFQRTPNYSIPAANRPMSSAHEADWKANYRGRREAMRKTRNNQILRLAQPIPGGPLDADERARTLQTCWEDGGFGFMYAYSDMTADAGLNAQASDFVRAKIRAVVKDPATAEKLTPKDYGIGGRRVCVDTGYYEIFNRADVSLVDLREDPIDGFMADGVRLRSGEVKIDVLALAIGFDAMTGALLRVDLTGRGGTKLKERWKEGPRNYLGLMVAGFPNLFTVTGPGSPSVLTNMVPSIEQHVDWIADCLGHLRRTGQATIEATPDAEAAWVAHVNEVGGATMLAQTRSWYNGDNIDGKPRILMPYAGGAAVYLDKITTVAREGYSGFAIG